MSITTARVEQPPAADPGALAPAALLAAAAQADQRIRLAEAERLNLAALWADANPVTEIDPLPARLTVRGDDVPTHPGLAGVTASAVAELAAQFAITTHAGTSLIADALELRHRLPLVWDRIMVGRFHVWRARQLAQSTAHLNDAAVAWIDRHAALAELNLGPRQLDDLVLRATALHDPERLPVADSALHVTIEQDRRSASGTAHLTGLLSGPDAADLEAAVQAEAAALGRTGDRASLDERRAAALGNLARAALGQPSLTDHPGRDTQPTPRSARRTITLYAHLSAASLGIGAGCQHCAGTTLADVPALGGLVNPEVIRQWCGDPAVRVTVTPVIDTATIIHTRHYRPTTDQQAQAAVREQACVFPYCHRRALAQPRHHGDHARTDLDHIRPHGAGGDTISDNLAPLCRRHHRLKTFTRWRYQMLSLDGIHLWTSPTGQRHLRTRTTTINLDARDFGGDDNPWPAHATEVSQARARLAEQEPRGESPPHGEHRTPPGDDPPDDPAPF